MAKVYEYKDEKFSVNVDKENDCALKVSKDGFTATVSVLEKVGKFRVSANDGLTATLENGMEEKLWHCGR